jgi:TRAP-type mannitol/chloroaromatic compound transport system permease small subunit
MVIAFLIMLYLGFAVATGAFQAYKFGDVTVGLISIPIWTILAAMSFSIFNFCASILLHFIAAIRGQSVAYDENIENLVS